MWTHAHTRMLRTAKLKSRKIRSQRVSGRTADGGTSDNQIHAVRGQSLTAASKQVSVCVTSIYCDLLPF